ncbi:cytochrome c-type biogenesis protein CcmE [Devosia crocina]|uniref:Cytochrome c-type biogenesis protein CcmE n=1 Tax=Devosia crocina TaxID=429728 RepID=A0A1I7NMB5_9HYPH|nr:cytochrome c maturation protein CcmE [Devosia crocina]SFV35813.1 cytochrome c-type biogenesis protein CcmE [Devosia crocina]
MSMSGAVRRKGWSRKQKRLAIIAGLGLVLALAAALVLTALRDQIVFFYSPTEIAARGVEPGQSIRLGGLVKEGSWTREGQENTFIVTDGASEITAQYRGILPDLFREGQGVVAEGAIGPDGGFTASNVLAKHDENYLPREVVDALKAQGEWRPEGDPS